MQSMQLTPYPDEQFAAICGCAHTLSLSVLHAFHRDSSKIDKSTPEIPLIPEKYLREIFGDEKMAVREMASTQADDDGYQDPDAPPPSATFCPNYYYSFGHAAAHRQSGNRFEKDVLAVEDSNNNQHQEPSNGAQLMCKLPLEKLPTRTSATQLASTTDLSPNFSHRQLARYILSNGNAGGLLKTADLVEWRKDSAQKELTGIPSYMRYQRPYQRADEAQPIPLETTAAQLEGPLASLRKALHKNNDAANSGSHDRQLILPTSPDSQGVPSRALLEKQLEALLKEQGLRAQKQLPSEAGMARNNEEVRQCLMDGSLHQSASSFIVNGEASMSGQYEGESPNPNVTPIKVDTPFLFEAFASAPNWADVATYGLATGLHEVALGILNSMSLLPEEESHRDIVTKNGLESDTESNPFNTTPDTDAPLKGPTTNAETKDIPLDRLGLLGALLDEGSSNGLGLTQAQFYCFMCSALLVDPSEYLPRLPTNMHYGKHSDESQAAGAIECLPLSTWLSKIRSVSEANTPLHKALILNVAKFASLTVDSVLEGLNLSSESDMQKTLRGRNRALFWPARSTKNSNSKLFDIFQEMILDIAIEKRALEPVKDSHSSVPKTETHATPELLFAAFYLLVSVCDKMTTTITPALNPASDLVRSSPLYYNKPLFCNGVSPSIQTSRADESPLRGSLLYTSTMRPSNIDDACGEHTTRVGRAVRLNVGNAALATAERLFHSAGGADNLLNSMIGLSYSVYAAMLSRFFSHAYLYANRIAEDSKANLSRNMLRSSQYSVLARAAALFAQHSTRSMVLAKMTPGYTAMDMSDTFARLEGLRMAATPEDLFLLRQAFFFSGPLLREEAAIANAPHLWSLETVRKLLNRGICVSTPTVTSMPSVGNHPTALSALEASHDDLVRLIPVPVKWIINELLPWLKSAPSSSAKAEVFIEVLLDESESSAPATHQALIPFPSPIPTWDFTEGIAGTMLPASIIQISSSVTQVTTTTARHLAHGQPEEGTSEHHKPVTASSSSKVTSTCGPAIATQICDTNLYLTLEDLLNHLADGDSCERFTAPFALIRVGLFQHLWTKFGGGDAYVLMAPRRFDCSIGLLCLQEAIPTQQVMATVRLCVGDQTSALQSVALLSHSTVGDALVTNVGKIISNMRQDLIFDAEVDSSQIYRQARLLEIYQTALITGEGYSVKYQCNVKQNDVQRRTKWRDLPAPFSFCVGELLVVDPTMLSDHDEEPNNELTSNLETLEIVCSVAIKDSIPLTLPLQFVSVIANAKSIPGSFGFQNVGNTCYLNSSLQCLSNLKLFREAFMSLALSISNPMPPNEAQRRVRQHVHITKKLRHSFLPKTTEALAKQSFTYVTAKPTAPIVGEIHPHEIAVKKAYLLETAVSRHLQELFRRIWSGQGDTITRMTEEEVEFNSFKGSSRSYYSSYGSRTNREPTSVSPVSLVESFEYKAGEAFRGRQQQDAMDFLSTFLNIIRDELGSGGSGLSLTGLGNFGALNVNGKSFKQRSLTEDGTFVLKRLLTTSPDSVLDPTELRNAIRSHLSHSSYVAEALSFWQDHLLNNPSIITRIMEGQRSTTMTCLRCGHCSCTHETTMINTVPLAEMEQKYGASMGFPTGVEMKAKASLNLDREGFSPFDASGSYNLINSGNLIETEKVVTENYCFDHPLLHIGPARPSNKSSYDYSGHLQPAAQMSALSDEGILGIILSRAKAHAKAIKEHNKAAKGLSNTAPSIPQALHIGNKVIGVFQRRVHPRARLHLMKLIAAWLHTVYVDVELRHEYGRTILKWGGLDGPSDEENDNTSTTPAVSAQPVTTTLIRLPIPTSSVDHHKIIIAGTQRYYFTHRHLARCNAASECDGRQIFGAVLLLSAPSSTTDGFLRPLGSPYHQECVVESKADESVLFEDRFADLPCRLRADHKLVQIPVLPPKNLKSAGHAPRTWVLLRLKQQSLAGHEDFLLVSVPSSCREVESLTNAIKEEYHLLTRHGSPIIDNISTATSEIPFAFPLSCNSGSPFDLPPTHFTQYTNEEPAPWWHPTQQPGIFNQEQYLIADLSFSSPSAKNLPTATPDRYQLDESLVIYSDSRSALQDITEVPAVPFGHINWVPRDSSVAVGYAEALTLVRQCAAGIEGWAVIERLSTMGNNSEDDNASSGGSTPPCAVEYYIVPGMGNVKVGSGMADEEITQRNAVLLFSSIEAKGFEPQVLPGTIKRLQAPYVSKGRSSSALFNHLHHCHVKTALAAIPSSAPSAASSYRYSGIGSSAPKPPVAPLPTEKAVTDYSAKDQCEWLNTSLEEYTAKRGGVVPRPRRSLLDYPIRLDAQLRDGGTTVQQHPDQYQCIDCGNSSGDALFGADITVLPPSFSVAFKRFTGGGGQRFIKNDRVVNFPLKIDFSTIVATGKEGVDFFEGCPHTQDTGVACATGNTSEHASLDAYIASWLDRCCRGGECTPHMGTMNGYEKADIANTVTEPSPGKIERQVADLLPELSPHTGHFLKAEILQKVLKREQRTSEPAAHRHQPPTPHAFLYALRGVVYHSGSLSGGHYTAACYNTEAGMWLDYNDSSVTPCERADGGKVPTAATTMTEMRQELSTLKEDLARQPGGGDDTATLRREEAIAKLKSIRTRLQNSKAVKPSYLPSPHGAYIIFYERVDTTTFDSIVEQRDIDCLIDDVVDLEAAVAGKPRPAPEDYHLVTADVSLLELQSAVLQRCAQWWYAHVTPLPKLQAAISAEFTHLIDLEVFEAKVKAEDKRKREEIAAHAEAEKRKAEEKLKNQQAAEVRRAEVAAAAERRQVELSTEVKGAEVQVKPEKKFDWGNSVASTKTVIAPNTSSETKPPPSIPDPDPATSARDFFEEENVDGKVPGRNAPKDGAVPSELRNGSEEAQEFVPSGNGTTTDLTGVNVAHEVAEESAEEFFPEDDDDDAEGELISPQNTTHIDSVSSELTTELSGTSVNSPPIAFSKAVRLNPKAVMAKAQQKNAGKTGKTRRENSLDLPD